MVVGTNDCSNGEEVSELVKEYSDLVDTGRTIAEEVIISSVCPRNDIQETETRCEALNSGLQCLAEEKDCEYVDHSPSFTLADGSVNEGFLIGKGPHLTRSGTNRLIRNLKLPQPAMT